jgi:hypothetical protein
MFRRKKQDAVEASAEEAGTVAPAEDGVEALTAPAADEAGGADGAGDVEGVEGVQKDEVTAGAAPEAVEIPKQQSAEAAADNEAGEGARR